MSNSQEETESDSQCSQQVEPLQQRLIHPVFVQFLLYSIQVAIYDLKKSQTQQFSLLLRWIFKEFILIDLSYHNSLADSFIQFEKFAKRVGEEIKTNFPCIKVSIIHLEDILISLKIVGNKYKDQTNEIFKDMLIELQFALFEKGEPQKPIAETALRHDSQDSGIQVLQTSLPCEDCSE